jgi:hypothetical protein
MREHASTQFKAAVQLRLKGETFISLENWRRSQSKIPSRSDAIRQLLERALGDNEQPAPAA